MKVGGSADRRIGGSTAATLLVAAVLLQPTILSAQSAPRRVIDSIVVLTRDVFEPQEVDVNPVFGAMNAIHVQTRSYVVRRELLFKVGEPLDSIRLSETERNLRRMGLFRAVLIQPRIVNGKTVVYVVTSDGWSTSLGLNARSTGGVFTWSITGSEGNLAGTGNGVGLGYRKDVDRTAVTASAIIPRIAGTPLRTSGIYDKLSDGHTAGLNLGKPYRSFSDTHSFDLLYSDARRRILQFRNGAFLQSFQQRFVRFSAQGGIAPYASPRGFFRLGLTAVVQHQEYVRSVDTLLAIPDTVTGVIGAGMDWRKGHFMVVRHFNGFARDEDIDLSSRIQLGTWFAPSAFGYQRNGIGPYIDAQTGWRLGVNFIRINARANGLFTSSGLDSGRTVGSITIASRVIPRQNTVLFIQGGLQRGLPGGFEFDLGHGVGPRSFEPHAFTGSRLLWGTLEHRIVLWDELIGAVGVGLAGFFDYGGAWYADQPPRKGGDVGIGLRLGATRATSTSVGRFDLGYRLGEGLQGNHWVFSFGRTVPF